MVFLFVSSVIKIEALHRSAASKTLLNILSTPRCPNVQPRSAGNSDVDVDLLFIVVKNGRFKFLKNYISPAFQNWKKIGFVSKLDTWVQQDQLCFFDNIFAVTLQKRKSWAELSQAMENISFMVMYKAYGAENMDVNGRKTWLNCACFP